MIKEKSFLALLRIKRNSRAALGSCQTCPQRSGSQKSCSMIIDFLNCFRINHRSWQGKMVILREEQPLLFSVRQWEISSNGMRIAATELKVGQEYGRLRKRWPFYDRWESDVLESAHGQRLCVTLYDLITKWNYCCILITSY